MAMQHIENELRKTGGPREQAFADVIASIHKLLGRDIPLPSLAGRVESNEDPVIRGLVPFIAAIEALIVGKSSLAPVMPEVNKEPESAKPEAPEIIEVHPENPFDLEWQKQARRYVELGFDKESGYKATEYIATLPKFDIQPEEYKGRLDIPLIVETRISLRSMILQLGINVDSNSSVVDYVREWRKEEFSTPKTPYVTWVNNKIYNPNKSAEEVRGLLKNDERGGSIFDGLALYLSKPKILDDYHLVFPGSQVYSSHVPVLCKDTEGHPVLKSMEEVENPYMGLFKFAFVIAGRKIKV